MHWWRKALTMLGLTSDARINVRAQDVEVVITGDPDMVRSLLEVVRGEIERLQVKKRRPGAPMVDPNIRAIALAKPKAVTESLIVPTELDDMDSPYAIPEHRPADASETPPPHEESEGEGLPTTVGAPTGKNHDEFSGELATQPPLESAFDEITSSGGRGSKNRRR